jgi:hypothetical protein
MIRDGAGSAAGTVTSGLEELLVASGIRRVESIRVRLRIAERSAWRQTLDCEVERRPRPAGQERAEPSDRGAHDSRWRPVEIAPYSPETGHIVTDDVSPVSFQSWQVRARRLTVCECSRHVQHGNYADHHPRKQLYLRFHDPFLPLLRF